MSGVVKTVKKVFKGIVKVVKKIWKPILIAVAVWFTAGAALGAFGAMAASGSALSGAGAGLSAAAAGNIGGAMAAGAATAGAAAGAGVVSPLVAAGLSVGEGAVAGAVAPVVSTSSGLLSVAQSAVNGKGFWAAVTEGMGSITAGAKAIGSKLGVGAFLKSSLGKMMIVQGVGNVYQAKIAEDAEERAAKARTEAAMIARTPLASWGEDATQAQASQDRIAANHKASQASQVMEPPVQAGTGAVRAVRDPTADLAAAGIGRPGPEQSLLGQPKGPDGEVAQLVPEPHNPGGHNTAVRLEPEDDREKSPFDKFRFDQPSLMGIPNTRWS